ncbi:MAG TPA: carboxypeptidase regulatory-like domain-containing protein [Bacteroidetes bacterium]|nr:carboxypeptidase regulatory-like domain-containing protein [Bacteroidota bacterium]
MKKIIFPSILLFLALFSCRKEINEFTITDNEAPPVVLIKNSIRGKVVDEEGFPVSNAEVSVGSALLTTDGDGNFFFEQIEVKKSGAIVKAETDGFFSGSSHSNFNADGSSFVEIRLMKKGTPNTVESVDGGTFTSNGGMEITIPAGAITTKTGSAFTGAVQVYSRWLDPSSADVAGIMPGALTASDKDGNPLALATYGMVAMELEAENGLPLEVAPGSEVAVKMPIPSSLLANAPDEIPLWYFDLEEEQWLQSGTCTKVGSYYHCNITSTGYWNCDVAVPAICLSGQVFNSDSTFACYMKVVVEDLTDNFIYWGYTDSIGYFCGSVPQAALLRLSIIDHCDSVIYTADIGPYSQDFQLDDIYLDDVVQAFFVNITGTVMHCVTNDVPSGHVAIRYPGKIRIYPFEAGGFDIDLALKCVDFPELKIRAYSSSQQFATEVINHNDMSDIDLGLLQTCDTLSDYFNLNVDGVDFWTSPTRYFFKNNTTTNWLVLEGLSGGGKFILDIRDYQGLGTYTANVFFKTENDVPLPDYPLLNTSSPDIVLVITDDDGEYISGNISGTGGAGNISADFKIRRAP